MHNTACDYRPSVVYAYSQQPRFICGRGNHTLWLNCYLQCAVICIMVLANSCRPTVKGKGSPYSITERRVPELIPVLGSQPAGDVCHKPDGRLPLLSARPAVTLATLKRAATNFADW